MVIAAASIRRMLAWHVVRGIELDPWRKPSRTGLWRRSVRSGQGDFVRHSARQFVRPRRLSRFMERGWYLRVRPARWAFRRRFGRMAWCCRWDVRRFDGHLHMILRSLPTTHRRVPHCRLHEG